MRSEDDDSNIQNQQTNRGASVVVVRSDAIRWTVASVAFETALCAPTVDSHDDGGGDTHADTATHGNDAREGERGVRVFTRSRARV